MVKTKHLVIGAATLSVTILTLYKIVEPHEHIMKFYRSNQTSNSGSASSSRLLTTINLQDSPARKMFENELSRISSNLKSGRIADQNPEPPVFYYKNVLSQQEPEVVQPNVAAQPQTFVSLHNQVVAANLDVPSDNDQQKKQNIQNIELPSDPDRVNTQNVYQHFQLPNIVQNQNMRDVQVPADSARQNISNSMNIAMPNAQTLQGWRVIHENAQIKGNQAASYDSQIMNQSVDQHKQKAMEASNNNTDGVWQPIQQKSPLSDLIQSVQKDGKIYKTY